MAWIGIVAGVGLGFTTFLTVLAEVGLESGGGPALPAATPESAVSPEGGGPAQSGGLTVTAKDLKFNPTKLSAPAGEAAITFKNEDATPHNLHVFEGKDNQGKSLGATAVKNGPGSETLKVTVAAGTYYFQCDVHPTQMKGTLTVAAAG
jgi:plastocyanin